MAKTVGRRTFLKTAAATCAARSLPASAAATDKALVCDFRSRDKIPHSMRAITTL